MQNGSEARNENKRLVELVVAAAFDFGTDSDEYRTANQNWFDQLTAMHKAERERSDQFIRQPDRMNSIQD